MTIKAKEGIFENDIDKSITKLLNKLSQYQTIIKDSNLFAETTDIVNDLSFSQIRCIALGSPSDSKSALYQLAYLLEIASNLNVEHENISIYDPIFNDEDELLLTKHLNFKIESKPTNLKVDKTLFFLPHAGLDITESLINEYEPIWLLSNDLISHTDRFSKQKLHDQYKTISLLVHILLKDIPKKEVENKKDDGFTTVKKTKKKNKNNNQKYIYQEPIIDYNFDVAYFSNIKLTRFEKTEGPWENAFTDLSFQCIDLKETVEGNEAAKIKDGEELKEDEEEELKDKDEEKK